MSNPHLSLESSLLKSFIIFPCEPLHDVMNSIENLLAELRAVLNSPCQLAFDEVMEATINNKTLVRGCDYIEAMILLTGKIFGLRYKS